MYYDPRLEKRLSVVLEDLPMSPSVNNSYKPIFDKRIGSTRFVSKQGLVDYKFEMKKHYLKNRNLYLIGLGMVQDWVKAKCFLQFNASFYFKRSSLFTKKNEPKMLDLDNRGKALKDAVSEFLGFNDKMIFREFSEKCLLLDDEKEEFVKIEIFPINQ